MDFPIALEPESAVPIYLQISRALKEHIVSGALKSGTKLPSSQELADSLSVARSTVVKAYEDLNKQGYSEAIAGSGTFVSKRASEARELLNYENPKYALESTLSRYAKELEKLESAGGATSVENQKLNYGAPPCDLLPLKSWKQVLLKQCLDLELNTSDLTPEPFGLYRCRQEIADYLCRVKGLKCSPEQVMIFAGCKESFALATRLLLNEGDKVAIENPSYEDPRKHFLLARAEIQIIDTDSEGLIVSQLQSKSNQAPRFVYLTPSQDPTGAIMPISRRKELLAWAENQNALIWEEAWDTDYHYSGPALPPLQSLDRAGSVIYSYSFWKLLYPLVTLGVLVLPPHLIEIFEKSRQISDIQFSMLEQKTLARFLQEGHLDRHLKKTRRVYEERRRILLEVLITELRGRIEIPKQDAGLHLCVRFAQMYKTENIVKAAEQARLTMHESSTYYLRNPRKNEFLIPFALMTEDLIKERSYNFANHLQELF